MRSITLKFIAATALLVSGASAFSQKMVPLEHRHDLEHTAKTTNAYAGQQARAIKALSDTQVNDMLAGKGMELAKAAELNGYPGPMHTLELADALHLSPVQREATAQLLAQHKAEVRALGKQWVEAERQLDQAFAHHHIDTTGLTLLTQHTGEIQAKVRNAHLETHLKQAQLLTPQQITQYSVLRGYSDTPASSQ